MSLFGPTFADGDRMEVAGVTVRLKVHSRARRVSLRLDRTRREFIATAPDPRRLGEAAAFARQRADWIAARLAELPAAQTVAPGEIIEIFGQACRLELAKRGSVQSLPEVLAARGEGAAYARSVIRGIRSEAHRVLAERTAFYCGQLGVKLPSVTIMDAKGRWGSCRNGRPGAPAAIRYSWRLALAPFEVADYVVAHECAHLIEQNHGPRFWSHVQALVGDPGPHRSWLRAHGVGLHAFGGDQ